MVPAPRFQLTSPFCMVGTRSTRSAIGCRLLSSFTRPAYSSASTCAAGTSSLKSGEKFVGLSQSPTTRVPPSWRAGSGWYWDPGGLAVPRIAGTEGSELQPPSKGSSARATTEALSGPRRGKGRVLDVIEDLAALPLEFALGNGAPLTELFELTHVGNQVHERRGKPLAYMSILGAVKLHRPGIPGLQVEERLQGGIGNAQGFDAILLHGHQAHGHPVARMLQLAVEIAPQDFSILEADGDLLAGPRLLVGGRRPGGEGDALDRGQRDERTLIVARLVRHLELDVRLVQVNRVDLALHDLVVKKPDCNGGGFSTLGTAHF